MRRSGALGGMARGRQVGAGRVGRGRRVGARRTPLLVAARERDTRNKRNRQRRPEGAELTHPKLLLSFRPLPGLDDPYPNRWVCTPDNVARPLATIQGTVAGLRASLRSVASVPAHSIAFVVFPAQSWLPLPRRTRRQRADRQTTAPGDVSQPPESRRPARTSHRQHRTWGTTDVYGLPCGDHTPSSRSRGGAARPTGVARHRGNPERLYAG